MSTAQLLAPEAITLRIATVRGLGLRKLEEAV